MATFAVASFFLCAFAVGSFCGLRIGARLDYNTTLQISNWVFVHPYVSADIGAMLALILSVFGKLPEHVLLGEIQIKTLPPTRPRLDLPPAFPHSPSLP